mgnify:CR=1 FL=1
MCGSSTSCATSDPQSEVDRVGDRAGGWHQPDSRPVVPASHMFTAPPLPTVDALADNGADAPGGHAQRDPVVRLAPSFNTEGAPTALLRLLPAVDAPTQDELRSLPPTEPGILPPHAKLTPIDSCQGDGDEDDANRMYLLPPTDREEATDEATDTAPQDEEPAGDAEVRRLPRLVTEGLSDAAAAADAAHVRRLPEIPADLPADTPADLPADLPTDLPADQPADGPLAEPVISETDLRNLPPLEGPASNALGHRSAPVLDAAALAALESHIHAATCRAAELATRGAYFAARRNAQVAPRSDPDAGREPGYARAQ